MGKKVRLLWKNDENRLVKEECYLLTEEDPLYDQDGALAPDGVWEALQDTGQVIFEDEEGVFALPPEAIIQIDVLEGEES